MRSLHTTLSTLLATASLVAVLGAGSAAPAQEGEYVPPPPEVVATSEPVYYEGRPAYWFGGRWHYRDGRGRWAYYREEPAFLRERREHRGPFRHYYYRHERR
jgi:hypothetical protein